MEEYRARALREFRRAWQTDTTAPAISDFLPNDLGIDEIDDNDGAKGRRHSVLIDLIATDVELRKSALADEGIDKAGGLVETQDVSSLVKSYIELFPELASPELRSLLAQRLEDTLAGDVFATQDEERDALDSIRGRQIEVATVVGDFDPSTSSDRYRRLAEHARGGMGIVWRVEDQKLGREIALKQLPNDPQPSERTRQRFVAEARVTAQLEHPGVVPIYDLTHLEDGQPSYTMRLLHGETLTTAIERFHQLKFGTPERTLARQRMLDAFLSVCQTIAYAHSHQVLHRDLKPDNIHLGEFGETAVLDWGLAKSLASQESETDEVVGDHATPKGKDLFETLPQVDSGSHLLTRQGELLGTPAYMAPEQAKRQPATEATDRYGLGAVLYQILTGRPPHLANDLSSLLEKITGEGVSAPRSVVADTPKPLEAICLKLLSKSPSDRYTETPEIVADLNRVAADEAVSCARESLRDHLFRWMRKHQSLVVTGIAALVLVAVSVVASLLVASANQAREFAQQQRLQQMQAAGALADAVSTTQMHNDNFAAAVQVIEKSLDGLGGSDELAGLVTDLSAKLERANNLNEFYRLLRQLYHYTINLETHSEYKAIMRCAELIGIDTSAKELVDWTKNLPDEDLSEVQQKRLREETHSLLLRLAAIQAFSGFGEFTRINANRNIFGVTTTDDIRSKFLVAERYLELAENYRTTTAARYIRTIIELGEGKLTLPEWLVKLYAVERSKPEGAVDCLFTGTVLMKVAQFSKSEAVKATAAVAQFATGSSWSSSEAEAEALLLVREAARLDPNSFPAAYQLAMLEAQTGNFKAGLALFNTAIKLDPTAPEAYSGRAANYYAQMLLTDAPERKAEIEALFQADLEKALQLGGQFGKILFEVGLLQCVNGEMEAGILNMLDGFDQNTLRITNDIWEKQKEFATLLQTIEVAANPEETPDWMRLLRGTFLVDIRQGRKAVPFIIDFPSEHAGYHRALAARILVACELVRGETPNWTKVHESLTEENLLKWSQEVTTTLPSYYRGWHARLELLGKLGRYEERLEDVVTALKKAKLKDWQKFELLWFKADCLEALERLEEAEAVRAEARELSEIYYEHFSTRTGMDAGA